MSLIKVVAMQKFVKMKNQKNIVFSIMMFFGLFVVCQPVLATSVQKKVILPNVIDNHKCFKCHGHRFFSFYNDVTGEKVYKRMNPFYVIDSVAFYHSNHRILECTDCHDGGYLKFPHNSQLQLQPMPTCLMCHEGDPATAQFHFDQIAKEFDASVHKKIYPNFKCAMCHNPHTYILTAPRDESIKKIVVYDNEMCLSCHSDVVNYKVLSDSAPKNITAAHEWLPNQKLHFQHVRCLDCHAKVQSDSTVDHLIMPKQDAVRNCVKCHSQNTMLMATLYKFRAKKSRSRIGFLNATILNQSYVISANRNTILNKASQIIFAIIVLIIIIHAILRIISK